MMIQFRPLPVMTLLSVAVLAALIAFGQWQWAKHLQERGAQQTPLPAVVLEDYEPLLEAVQLVYGVVDGVPGWRILAPVRRVDGVVFVDAGFFSGPDPPSWRAAAQRLAVRYGEPLEGRLVPAPVRPSPFTPPPVPAAHVWHAIDLPAMAQAAGIQPGGAMIDAFVAIPYIGEDGRPVPNPFAEARADPTPPERHLGYALTWWGFAVVLAGVYFAYHISAGRLRLGRNGS